MEKILTLLLIKEMQTKAKMGHHFLTVHLQHCFSLLVMDGILIYFWYESTNTQAIKLDFNCVKMFVMEKL